MQSSLLDAVDSNPVQPLSIQLTVPYFGYGYSNEFSFLANTGTDVILLSDEVGTMNTYYFLWTMVAAFTQTFFSYQNASIL
jgi:hypothetical protein